MAVAEGVQVGVEFWGVVKVFEVGEFVEHYVLAQVWGKEHQADVQVYVSFCRAGAPVGFVVFYGDFVYCQVVLGCELVEFCGELCFGLFPEFFKFCGVGGECCFVTGGEFCEFSDYFVAVCSKK